MFYQIFFFIIPQHCASAVFSSLALFSLIQYLMAAVEMYEAAKWPLMSDNLKKTKQKQKTKNKPLHFTTPKNRGVSCKVNVEQLF